MNKIYINGRFLSRSLTGVERYADCILKEIERLLNEDDKSVKGYEFYLLCPASVEKPIWIEKIKFLAFGKFTGHLWEQIDLRMRCTDGLLLNLCNTGPVFNSKQITCLHDAHVWLVPENFSKKFRVLYKIIFPILSKYSAGWFSVSKYSSAQLIRLFGDEKYLGIVGNAADHVHSWGTESVDGLSLDRRYFFALGSASFNKNIKLLFSLEETFKKNNVDLVISGGGYAKVFGGIGELPAWVKRTGRVNDAQIRYLLENSCGFLFPSFYEGFGIPPLEAMALSVPVISSSSSALPEVCGDGALLCDPLSNDSWSKSIDILLSNHELREKLILAGLERSSHYSWRKSALELMEIAKHTLSRWRSRP